MTLDFGDACPELFASFGRTPDWTLSRFIEAANEFVAGFMKLHPKFADMRLCGKSAKDSPPLMLDLSNLRPWLMERSWADDRPHRYTALGANGKPTLASNGSVGFELGLTNATGFDGKVSLTINAVGAESLGSNLSLVLPRKAHAEFESAELPLALLELTMKHWPVERAYYAFQGWGEPVLFDKPPKERRPNLVGWLTYLDDLRAIELMPPELGLEPRRLGPGVLLQLTPHMSRYDDEADVARGKALKAALDDGGLYSQYAIPPSVT